MWPILSESGPVIRLSLCFCSLSLNAFHLHLTLHFLTTSGIYSPKSWLFREAAGNGSSIDWQWNLSPPLVCLWVHTLPQFSWDYPAEAKTSLCSALQTSLKVKKHTHLEKNHLFVCHLSVWIPVKLCSKCSMRKTFYQAQKSQVFWYQLPLVKRNFKTESDCVCDLNFNRPADGIHTFFLCFPLFSLKVRDSKGQQTDWKKRVFLCFCHGPSLNFVSH